VGGRRAEYRDCPECATLLAQRPHHRPSRGKDPLRQKRWRETDEWRHTTVAGGSLHALSPLLPHTGQDSRLGGRSQGPRRTGCWLRSPRRRPCTGRAVSASRSMKKSVLDPATVILARRSRAAHLRGGAAGQDTPVRVTVYRFVDDAGPRLNATRRRNSAAGRRARGPPRRGMACALGGGHRPPMSRGPDLPAPPARGALGSATPAGVRL
jgi:hypothetical protein